MKVELIRHTLELEDAISDDAGICYDAKPTTSKNRLKRLKADGHFATFRFAHVTFEISEFSRTCSMQQLRHKFLDFLQRSQRYCNELEFSYVTPHTIIANPEALAIYDNNMAVARHGYTRLKDLGIPKEDARYLLPESTHTKMRVVGSVQAWYDYLYGNAGRLQPKAQWEIREVATEIERQLSGIAPNIFGR